VVNTVPDMALRGQMAEKAKAKCTRFNGFSRELPSDWGPYKIINPSSGIPFTDDTAWELIIRLLMSPECTWEFVELEKPPRVKAIFTEWTLVEGQPKLYIKIHLGAGGKIFGRSFHYSYKY
jgi:hypothetical protein